MYLLYITLLFFISSCTVGPDFHRPTPPTVQHYTRENIESQSTDGVHFVYNKPLPKQWWQLFNSKAINDLITEALAHNQTLAAAYATVTQAQQNLNAVAGTQLPQVGLNAAVTPQQFAPAIYGFGQFPTTAFVLYTASVNVSYNLDLFGALKRQVEAYGALVKYQAYQFQGASLTLVTNVTNIVFKLALLNAQITNTRAIIAAQESLLSIARKQFLTGGIAKIDVNTIEKTLLQTKASLPDLEKSLDQTKNLLAVYLGKIPSEVKINDFKLDDFKPLQEIPLILPSTLARQRPDILASEALLHQANAQVGVATANMYPQFNITASGGPIAAQNTWQSLSGQSWIWSIGPAMTLPIFSGGTLTAQKKAAIAGFEIALANYKQTVLQGLQNVADCLSALKQDSKALIFQEKYYAAANENLLITQKQYKAGGVSLSQLLNSQILFNQALINKEQARSLKLTDTVALFQALGGGWWQ
ncbi:MAG TPA: efflux transporter outer membrane subunit [Aquella sp.]|nr:efflux transporter outer membrane subunit [Aquella sp.]